MVSTDDNKAEWKSTIERSIKKGFASIDKLKDFELDALFSL